MNVSKTVLSFLVVLMLMNSSFAQSKMQVAKMKQRVMTELKVNEVKADSAVSIISDFYKNARAIRTNPDIKDENRKMALQTNRKTEMGRLRAAGFSMEEMMKLKQMMEEMKEERQHKKKMAKDSASAS